MTDVYRIGLVDDHPIVRRGLTQLIEDEDDLSVCGEAEDVASALRLVEETSPDVLIVDIILKESNGLDLTARLHQQYQSLPCLIVSMHDEYIFAERALRAGARGYVMKQHGDELVVTAIRRVLDGGIYLSDELNNLLLGQIVGRRGSNGSQPLSELSNRELEVFRAMGEGHSTGEIAKLLGVNHKTVETYRRRIRSKLNIESSRQLAVRAVEWTMGEG